MTNPREFMSAPDLRRMASNFTKTSASITEFWQSAAKFGAVGRSKLNCEKGFCH
jgi:hypothetical protein